MRAMRFCENLVPMFVMFAMASCSGSSSSAVDSGGLPGGADDAAGTVPSAGPLSDAGGGPDLTVPGMSDAARSTVVGLWDGSYTYNGDGGASAVPFIVLVDESGTVYLAERNGAGRGKGSLTATGDIVITVTGSGDNEAITFVGKVVGDSGSGTWANAANGRTGTWTITRRADSTLGPEVRATCERLSPCMGAPGTAPSETSVADCLIAFAAPSPAMQVMMGQLKPCMSAASCEAMWACFGQGALDKVHVAPTGNDDNDGATPGKPKRTLNAAIAATRADGTVLVAAGTYAEAVFIGRPVTLQGGYDAGFTRIDPSASVVTIDAQSRDSALTTFSPTVTASRLVVKGLQLVNGLADGSFGGYGGGLRIGGPAFAEIVLEDCTFSRNRATASGGGVSVSHGKLTVTRCTFEDNVAQGNGGGGININEGTLVVRASIFRNNVGGEWGGAINSWQTDASIEGCSASGNSAHQCGGGFQLGGDKTHTLKDNVVTGNTPNNTCGPFTNLGGNTLK